MNQKAKVAIISNVMCVGGVEIALIEMLKAFDYDLYEVTLYLREPGGAFFTKLDNRVTVRYWGQTDSRHCLAHQLKSLHFISFAKGLYNRISARRHRSDWARNEFAAIKSLGSFSDEQYDVVIAYHGATPGVLATALYGLNGKQRVAWIHGKDSFPVGNELFWSKQYESFHKIACVSDSIQSWFTKQYPTTSGKTSVLYNLLDADRILALAEEKPEIPAGKQGWQLLTVGRLSEVKGQTMIPKTCRILLDMGHEFYWYLVGDGPLRTKIEQEICKYRVSDRVFLLGTKENPYPYIKNCDIYVQTSFSEGYCTTTMEAKILHKPVVTTNAPGMREQFVSGENGLIVDAMTPEALANGIASLLDHPALREKIIKNLKQNPFDNLSERKKIYDFIRG